MGFRSVLPIGRAVFLSRQPRASVCLPRQRTAEAATRKPARERAWFGTKERRCAASLARSSRTISRNNRSQMIRIQHHLKKIQSQHQRQNHHQRASAPVQETLWAAAGAEWSAPARRRTTNSQKRARPGCPETRATNCRCRDALFPSRYMSRKTGCREVTCLVGRKPRFSGHP